jgi:uncharacterized protein (TIGR03083 family)
MERVDVMRRTRAEKSVDHAEHCDALESEVDRFAYAMSRISGDTDVVTCPGWTVDDVALHLGMVHRWAEELVRNRSAARIPRATPSLDEVSVSPEWLRQGGQELVATLRAADPSTEMWAWGLDQHVRFWSRRQVHETLVHRMDIELAGGIDPAADATLASDAIDEFLSNLQKVVNGSRKTSLIGNGQRLALRTTDANGVWSITLRDGGFDLTADMSDYDTLVEGPSVELLLVIVRRRQLGESRLDIAGDKALVEFWLANSAFD